MSIRWWNVNGRWIHINKKFMKNLDIIFLSETHCVVKVLDGFTKYGDPAFQMVKKHGGVAVYVRDEYVKYFKNLRFSKSTISFSLSPNLFFTGVYIYQIDSRNYEDTDYGSVVNDINYWLTKGYHPYIGSDYNSRIGDINKLSEKSLKWRYSKNVDHDTNSHCALFSDMCELLNILPLNHSCYRGYTYFKGNKILLESGPKESPRLNIFKKKFNVAKGILADNADNIIK